MRHTSQPWWVADGVVVAMATGIALWLCGCAATRTALTYKDLDIQTRMSSAIMLDAVPPDQRSVYLEITSTADQDLDLSVLATLLHEKGYRVSRTPGQEHYQLHVHVLFVGKTEQAALDNARLAGFGGPLAGAGVARLTLGGSVTQLLLGAGLGALAETVSGSLVKKTVFAVVTDIELAERLPKPVEEEVVSELSQGDGSVQRTTVRRLTRWQRYRTRATTEAVRVNLKFHQAKPGLEASLVQSLAGLLVEGRGSR